MKYRRKQLPEKTIDNLVFELGDILYQLNGYRIAIFGGTGFIGSWLTSTLVRAMEKGLELNLNIICRNPSIIKFNVSKISKGQINFIPIDLSKSVPLGLENMDKFVVASTPTSLLHGNHKTKQIDEATKNLIKFFNQLPKSRIFKEKTIVHLSSGAVYKCHKQTTHPYMESDETQITSEESYINSKISIENALKKLASQDENFRVTNPRLFAFYGPGLPLNQHFAIGNFLRDATRNMRIDIQGNPSTIRSYMHISDLTRSLLKLLVNPFPKPINLGSSKPQTMLELAETIRYEFNSPGLKFSRNSSIPSYYVPDISNATKVLGDIEKINFKEGLHEWMDWLNS